MHRGYLPRLLGLILTEPRMSGAANGGYVTAF